MKLNRKSRKARLFRRQIADKQDLTTFVGTVGTEKMAEVCWALAVASGCD